MFRNPLRDIAVLVLVSIAAGAMGTAVIRLCVVIATEEFEPRYTVTIKNTDTVHRNSRIRIKEGAVLHVMDAAGREYFYREGWEVVEEVK